MWRFVFLAAEVEELLDKKSLLSPKWDDHPWVLEHTWLCLQSWTKRQFSKSRNGKCRLCGSVWLYLHRISPLNVQILMKEAPLVRSWFYTWIFSLYTSVFAACVEREWRLPSIPPAGPGLHLLLWEEDPTRGPGEGLHILPACEDLHTLLNDHLCLQCPNASTTCCPCWW